MYVHGLHIGGGGGGGGSSEILANKHIYVVA